jgi:hypothetical protein
MHWATTGLLPTCGPRSASGIRSAGGVESGRCGAYCERTRPYIARSAGSGSSFGAGRRCVSRRRSSLPTRSSGERVGSGHACCCLSTAQGRREGPHARIELVVRTEPARSPHRVRSTATNSHQPPLTVGNETAGQPLSATNGHRQPFARDPLEFNCGRH